LNQRSGSCSPTPYHLAIDPYDKTIITKKQIIGNIFLVFKENSINHNM